MHLCSMRSATSKFVTIFDVCVVVGACLCGALSGLFGFKIIQDVNSRLSEVCDFYEIFFLSQILSS